MSLIFFPLYKISPEKLPLISSKNPFKEDKNVDLPEPYAKRAL